MAEGLIGAPATAPCGHRGEAVFVGYVRCLEGCEGAPASDLEPEAPAREHEWKGLGSGWSPPVCRFCNVAKGRPGADEPCRGNGASSDPKTCKHPSKYGYAGGIFCSSCGKKF